MNIIQLIGLISGVLLFIFSIYIGYIVIFQGNEGIRKASSIIDGFIDSGKIILKIVYGILFCVGIYFLTGLLIDFFMKVIK
ncbi:MULTISPECIES: hypothetical protein [Bacteria]|jgi:hypothetical protein|uniref:hypothetical protein n=1 Tax=Bacteria TaxID=2 RepID=UPI002A81484B|nr:hypothetical protein [Clostridium sp.]MDY4252866.1 hypothetical protein [Clostridium sp.]MDY5306140.1 hypothetical protein [Fusobacterium gastrosuis]